MRGEGGGGDAVWQLYSSVSKFSVLWGAEVVSLSKAPVQITSVGYKLK